MKIGKVLVTVFLAWLAIGLLVRLWPITLAVAIFVGVVAYKDGKFREKILGFAADKAKSAASWWKHLGEEK
jgi:hypothetical protein